MIDTKNLFKLLLNHLFTVKDETSKKIKRFKPNKSQIRILKTVAKKLKEGKKAKIIIVKGRQVGGSSLIQRMQLDCALSIPNFNCYVQAHDQQSASRMFLENVKNVFDRMEFYKDFYTTSLDNVNQLYLKKFSGNLWSSEIRVGTSARSAQVDFLHISEAGKIGNFEIKWKELVNGTLQAGEQALITIIETTAEGKNLFYDWVEVQKSNPDWEILFLSWTDKELYQKEPPESDDWIKDYNTIAEIYSLEKKPVENYNLSKEQFYWYYLKAKELGRSIKQEYPLSMEEAFATSSDSFFNKVVLEKAYTLVKQPVEVKQGDDWKLEIYRKPTENEIFFCGVDTSGEGQDNYSCDVLDMKGEQVAHLSGQFKKGNSINIETNFLEQFKKVLVYFNNPYLAIEKNGSGRIIQDKLIESGYPILAIWRDTTLDSIGNNIRSSLGWITTTKSRPELLLTLRTNFETDKLKINSVDTLKEFDTFVKIEDKWQAQAGKHDDRVISIGLSLQAKIFAFKTSG